MLFTIAFSILFFAAMFLCTYFSPALTRLAMPQALTSGTLALFLKSFQRAVFAVGIAGILLLMVDIVRYPEQIMAVETFLALSVFSGMCLGTGLHLFRKKS